jgi:type II secretory pathway pseudopilin PulG
MRQAKGFALIDLLFTCGLIGVLAIIAMPRLLMARQAAGAASAIGSMRAVNSSQLTFALTCGGGFYAPKLTTLGTAPPGSDAPYISANLGRTDTVVQSGYTIQLTTTPYPGSPPTCNGLAMGQTGQGFKAAADPMDVENRRFFALNSNGQIWEDSNSLWAGMPETGQPSTGHLLK